MADMPSTYRNPRYAHRAPPALGGTERLGVVVAGAGLVGLTLALDLAQRGVAVTVLDEDDTVSVGSRAICFAKRTLEIYGRLGLGRRLLDKGITWRRGRVFHGESEAYGFDLLPEEGHEYPAFVNLQQYYVEEWLVEACEAAGVPASRRSRTGPTRWCSPSRLRPAPTGSMPSGCWPATARDPSCGRAWAYPSPARCSATGS
jgi:3-(3-hydroxy-phenyl)propionate hydroxylase